MIGYFKNIMESIDLQKLNYCVRMSEKRLLGLLQLKESNVFENDVEMSCAIDLNIVVLENDIRNQKFFIKQLKRSKSR